MSTIKISELATSNIALTDFLAKADSTGLASKNTIQNLANLTQTIGDVSFKGSVFASDATVTLDGWYLASDNGTYTNNGGFLIDLSDNVVIIIVSQTQTIFEELIIPISITIDVVPTIGSANAIGSGAVFNEFLLKTNETDTNNLIESVKYNTVPVDNRDIIEKEQLSLFPTPSHFGGTAFQSFGFWSKAVCVSDKIIDKIKIPLYSLTAITGDLRVKIFVNSDLKIDLTVPNADIGDITVTQYRQAIDLGKRLIAKTGDSISVGWELTTSEKFQLVYNALGGFDPSNDFGNTETILVSSDNGVIDATEVPSNFSTSNFWVIPFNLESYQVFDNSNPQKYIKLEGIDNLKVGKTTNILNTLDSTNSTYINDVGGLSAGSSGYNSTNFIKWDGENNVILGLSGVEKANIFSAAQYDINGVFITGSNTGISYNQSTLAKYSVNADSFRLTYTSQNQINYGTSILPFSDYGFIIKETTNNLPVFFKPSLQGDGDVLTNVQPPKKIYTVFNDIKGIGANDLFNVRFNSSTIHFDNLLKDIDLDLDVNLNYNGNEKEVIFSDELTVDKLSELKTVAHRDSLKYKDGSFDYIKKSVKSTPNKSSFPKIMCIGDSVTSGYLSSVAIPSTATMPQQYWSVIKNQFEKDKIDGGDVSSDYNCLTVGKQSKLEWDLSYSGVTARTLKTYAEGYGGWQTASHLYWSKNWSLPTSQGLWDLLGLGDGTGSDYGDSGDSELVRTTPEGKFAPIDTPSFLAYIQTNLDGSANDYNSAITALNNLQSNPDNPFYDKTTAISEDVAFSIEKYLDRYKTLDSDGVTRLVVGSTAGTEVTDVTDYDVVRPTHFVIQHSHNDGNISWFATNMRKWTTQIKAEYSANGWGDVSIGLSIVNHTGTYYPKRYPMFERSSITKWSFDESKGFDNFGRLISEFWVDDANEDTEKIFILPTNAIQPPAFGTPYRRVDDSCFELTGLPEHQKLVIDGAGADYHPNGLAHRSWGVQMYAWIKYTLSL
tara:strand:- start:87 stop:3086 length:3000 start_codon:yes stop_codon:yes gene_type:complete